MPLSLVGFGTWAEANNAAITPSLPSGLQDGDLLIAAITIKENAAAFGAPAGWQARNDQAGAASESRVAAFTRTYQTGDSAPTFTPTGGGANDTVLGVILALRGSTKYVDAAVAVENTSGNTVGIPYIGPISPGDFVISLAHKTNDSAAAPTRSMSLVTLMGASYGSSLLGSDATADVAVWRSDTWTVASGNGGTNGSIAFDGTGDTSFCFSIVIRRPFEVTGSGGAIVGGAATCRFVPNGTHYYDASGGAVGGGAATTSLKFAPGVKLGVIGNAASKVGLGSLNVTIPATTQVDDLILVLHHVRKVDGFAYPAWPNNLISTHGFTFLNGYSANTGPFIGSGVWWKRATADDIGKVVTVTYDETDVDAGKALKVITYRNVDYVNGPIQASQAYNVVSASNVVCRKTATTTVPLTRAVSFNCFNGPSSIAFSGECATTFGFTEQIDQKVATLPSTGMLMWLGDCNTTSTRTVTEECLTAIGTAYNGAFVHFSICGLGEVYEYAASGGAIVNPNFSYLPPGGIPNNYTGSGGAIANPAGQVSFVPKPLRQAISLVAAWDAIGSSLISGWFVRAYVNGIERKLTQLTIRRKDTSLSAQLKFVDNLILAAGDTVTVDVEYRLAGGTSFSIQVLSAAIEQSISGHGFTEALALASNQQINGAQFNPTKVIMQGASMTRTSIDWSVRPGDVYGGRVIQEITTTLGTNSNWFTEVRYG